MERSAVASSFRHPAPSCLRRLLVGLVPLVTLVIAALPASAADTIASAQPLPLATPTTVQLIGAPVQAQYWTLELGLSERIRLDVYQPQTPTVTIRVFRPGVTDANVGTAKPAYAGTAAQTLTPKRAAFFADTPGRWVIQAVSDVSTTFTLTATQLQAPTPNPRPKAFTSVVNAPGLIVGTTYTGTTFDAAEPTLVSPRIARILAGQGDRVSVDLAVTNRRGLRVDIFEPGTSDGEIATAKPVASIDLSATGATMTLAFTAKITGEYLIRGTSISAGGTAPIRPTVFTVRLVDVAPPDLQPPCAEAITNIGRTRVKGCLEAGPNGTYTTTEPITISGVILEPINRSKLVINPATLEVTSAGLFEPVIWNIRLPAGNYFELSGTRELNLLDPTRNFDGSPRDPSKTGADQTGDARGLQWSDVIDGRSDVNGPEVGGLPLTGKIVLTWSLDNGGQASVTGNANIPGWGITGTLAFAVSNDNGLEYARVAFGTTDTAGLTFNAQLKYREEIANALRIDVWSADFKADVGTSVPPAMLSGGEGSLEIRDGILAYVRVGVRTQIAIGSTGLFMTRAGLSLRWKPYVAITGFGTVAAGPPVGGVAAIEVSGEGGYAGGGSCLGSTAQGDRWFFDGSAAIAQWFTIGNFGLCYQGVERPFVSVYAKAGFSAAGIVEGRATLNGYIDGNRAFLIEGNADMRIFGVGATGTVVLSDYGFAACGTANIKALGLTRRVAVGWERRWSDGASQGAFSCPEFAPYRTVVLARSARLADGWPVIVPAGAGQVNVIAIGVDGAVPAVEILDATGRVIARSASTTENSVDNVLFIPRTETGEMLIAAPIATAGTYRIRAQAGSSIANIRTSLPRPDVGIQAEVAMRGRYGTLRYQLTDLAGRTVEFWEVGDGVGRRIGTARRASGEIRFNNPRSLGKRHRIEAVVIDGGVPSPRRTVTTFQAPKLVAPAAPTGIRATRSGRTLTIRWQPTRRAIAYRIRLVDTDGRRVSTIVTKPGYRMRASRENEVLVEVTAIGYGELRSKPTRSRLT